jgi:hypothetical protein
MQTPAVLLRIGGAANAIFFLFHLWMGWQLHGLTRVGPEIRSLLEMLNGGGALFILLLVIASLACTTEMITTRLGHTVMASAAALYLLRALAEVVVSPRCNVAILGTCLFTGLVYLIALVLACRTPLGAEVEVKSLG